MVQPVHAQVVVVLQIVNRGNPVGVLEPGDISLTGIFADQQFVRDYAHRRSPAVASRARRVVGAFAEPINHDSNVTIRAVSIPASRFGVASRKFGRTIDFGARSLGRLSSIRRRSIRLVGSASILNANRKAR